MKAVPSRLLLPILDTCSVEDSEDLQERWAGLLATASQEGDSLSPSFIETLKQLTPNEARHLDQLFAEVSRLHKREMTRHDAIPYHRLTEAGGSPKGAMETFERLGLIQKVYDVKLDHHSSAITSSPDHETGTLSDIEDALDSLEAEIQHKFVFTAFGITFLDVCRGPKKPA